MGDTRKKQKKIGKIGSEKLENRGHIGSVSITIKSCEADISDTEKGAIVCSCA